MQPVGSAGGRRVRGEQYQVLKQGLAGIPRHQRAHLMYYLHCVCFLLELNHDNTINRLRQYRRYKHLTPRQIDKLIALCLLLSPDRLQEKFIYHNNRLSLDRTNRFHLIEDAEVELDVDEALIDLDDETKRCVKVMTFKMNWIDYYWTEPMLALVKERERHLRMEKLRSSFCSIL